MPGVNRPQLRPQGRDEQLGRLDDVPVVGLLVRGEPVAVVVPAQGRAETHGLPGESGEKRRPRSCVALPAPYSIKLPGAKSLWYREGQGGGHERLGDWAGDFPGR
ncbi:MAG: hypothetical protein MZV64_11325 [Ignavibacteriales bacterium]|nr:hypothetical protein [Ignavibacteriales bacterium]